jgi:hypothetical protein
MKVSVMLRTCHGAENGGCVARDAEASATGSRIGAIMKHRSMEKRNASCIGQPPMTPVFTFTIYVFMQAAMLVAEVLGGVFGACFEMPSPNTSHRI